MPRNVLALSECYYRRMLYGCTILLSAAIVVALLLFAYSAFEQFRDRRMGIFVNKREQIKSEVDRLSARVTQFSEMYGRLEHLYEKDELQVDGYWSRNDGDGISLSHKNLTVMPFSLVTRYTIDQDRHQLATLLLLLRQASALPMFNPAEPDVTLDGFIYTADHNFLAISPPLTANEKFTVHKEGIQNFIGALSVRIDAAFARTTEFAANAQGSSGQKIIWMGASATAPLTRVAVTRLAVRFFLEKGNMATAVFSVPRSQFCQFFMHNEYIPGLFVLDGQPGGSVLSESSSPHDAALKRRIQENSARINSSSYVLSYFYQNGGFFITQKIDGPGWNVVYVFEWSDIFKGLHGVFTTGALWGLFAVLFVWAATLCLDKFVIGPLQKKAMALIETQQFSQSIIDTLPVGIVVYAPAMEEVVLQNAVAIQMLEYSSLPHADFYAQILKECRLSETPPLRGLELSTIEAKLKLRDGGTHYFDVVWSLTRFAGQDVVLLGLIDMNMHKANEALMLEAKSSADRANQAKSMFLAQVSHEIRTPLHGAIGHMELLTREVLSIEQRKRIELIRHSFDMLMGLVNDILDITKIESKAIRLKLVPINVNDLLEQCAQLFAPLALNKGLQFYCLPDPALEAPRIGDDQRLRQILQNLVGNALKFTEYGSISLSSKKVQRSDGQTVVRFEVADTGIGISSDARQRIFESLEQADDTISSRFGGTGLGLSLCRHLAELMHGEVTVESRVGKGSLFGVEIPLLSAAQEDEITPRVLEGRVVDLQCHTPALREMLCAYLQSWGAQLHHDAPQLPVDFCVVAQDCQPEPHESSALTGRYTVVISTDTSRQPAYAVNLYHVSAYDRHSWLQALAGLPPVEPLHKAHTAPKALPAKSVGSLDILVAEDDHVNMTLIEHQLHELGYHNVRLAKDGSEVLKQWLQRKPDILITDLGMPRLDGISLAREIRKFDAQAIVVATTAANPLSATRDLDVFSDVMYKPVSLRDLQRILSRIVKQDEASPRLPQQQPATSPDPFEQVLIDAFFRSWPQDRDKLQQAINEQEHVKVGRILHRLQGGMLVIGQDEFAAESLALQQAIHRGDVQIMQQCLAWLAKVDRMCLRNRN